MEGDEDTVIYQDDMVTPRDTASKGDHDMSYEEIENT